MEKKIYVVYHRADFDGFASGVITIQGISHLHGNDKKTIENEGLFVPVPYNYEDDIYVNKDGLKLQDAVKYDDTVYFVDCSYTKDVNVVKQIIDKIGDPAQFILIDHHESAIEWYKKNCPSIEMSWSENSSSANEPKSAAILCWNKFFSGYDIPVSLQLISDYDIWKRDEKWERETLPFQYGLRSEGIDMSILDADSISKFWKILTNNAFTTKYIEIGDILLKELKSDSKSIIRSFSHEFIIHMKNGKTYRAFGAPGHLRNSTLFEYGSNEEYLKQFDLLILERPDPINGTTAISIISNKDDIDASELCSLYNGGGHKKIGGCIVRYSKMPGNDKVPHVEFVDA